MFIKVQFLKPCWREAAYQIPFPHDRIAATTLWQTLSCLPWGNLAPTVFCSLPAPPFLPFFLSRFSRQGLQVLFLKKKKTRKNIGRTVIGWEWWRADKQESRVRVSILHWTEAEIWSLKKWQQNERRTYVRVEEVSQAKDDILHVCSMRIEII